MEEGWREDTSEAPVGTWATMEVKCTGRGSGTHFLHLLGLCDPRVSDSTSLSLSSPPEKRG